MYILNGAGTFLQAVYGVLHSMEGLDTFADIMTHTRTQRWYDAVQREVARHAGAE